MNTEKFYGICLQGDVLEALDYLKSHGDKSESCLKLIEKYERRFITKDEIFEEDSRDDFVQNILRCYYVYFQKILTTKDNEKCENQLVKDLREILEINEEIEIGEIEDKLRCIFMEKGYSFLGGRTGPYLGPYIWKETDKKAFYVELPCCCQKVTVFFISGFSLLSWAYFATFGKRHTGGWAKDEGLYYVNKGDSNVDTTSDDFQVWFLKHEAQHLSDYSRYPKLKGAELEYRAKLVELIYHPEALRILEGFVNSAKKDKNLPHPYAAFLIVKRLSARIFGEDYVEESERWSMVDEGEIAKESLSLFLENERLLESGAEND